MNQSEPLVQLVNAIRNSTSKDEQNELNGRLISEISPGLEFFIRNQSVGEQVEDLLQSSLLEITNSLKNFRGTVDPQFRAFCDKIVRRVVAKHLRKLKRNIVETYDPDELQRISERAAASSGLSIEQILDFKYVIEILRRLAKKCLELVTKRYFHGMDYQSIADEFGLSSADRVRMRISRCCREAEARINPNH